MSTSFTPTSNWSGRTVKGRLSNGARTAGPLNLTESDGADAIRADGIAPEERSFAPASDIRAAREPGEHSDLRRDTDAGLQASPSEAAVIGGAAAEDAAYTPAYARTRKRSNSKAWMVAAPAVLAAGGLLAWTVVAGSGGEAAVTVPDASDTVSLASGPAPAAPLAEPLAGMPMTDLGAPPAPVVAASAPAEASAPTVRRVSTRAEAPAASRRAAPAPRTEAPAPARAEATPIAATAPAEIELAPVPAAAAPAPAPTAPASQPIIVTEPLAVPD